MAEEKEVKTTTEPTAEAAVPTTEDSDIPALVDSGSAAGAAAESKKETRSEKKSKKAMAKLGLKPVDGVTRVTLKKGKNMLFVIAQPDVYKNPNSETYVIFGEAKVEDPTQNALGAAARQFEEAAVAGGDAAPAPAAAAESETVDESGVEPNDIELVVGQTGATRAAAVKAIREAGGDIVNAIMALTK